MLKLFSNFKVQWQFFILFSVIPSILEIQIQIKVVLGAIYVGLRRRSQFSSISLSWYNQFRDESGYVSISMHGLWISHRAWSRICNNAENQGTKNLYMWKRENWKSLCKVSTTFTQLVEPYSKIYFVNFEIAVWDFVYNSVVQSDSSIFTKSTIVECGKEFQQNCKDSCNLPLALFYHFHLPNLLSCSSQTILFVLHSDSIIQIKREINRIQCSLAPSREVVLSWMNWSEWIVSGSWNIFITFWKCVVKGMRRRASVFRSLSLYKLICKSFRNGLYQFEVVSSRYWLILNTEFERNQNR